MICLRCNGDRWLRRTIILDAHIYGEPRPAIVVKVCPVCRGTGTVKLKPPVQTLDATES